MNLIRPFWHNLPLASKIAVFASVLVILIVSTLTLLTIQRERESFRNELEANAILLLDTLSERLRDPLINEQINEIDAIAIDLIDHNEVTRFKVYNKNGVLKVDAAQLEKDIPIDTAPLHPSSLSQDTNQPVFYWDDGLIVEKPVRTKVERVGFVQMGFSTAPLDERIRVLTVGNFTVVSIALLIGILMAILMARQLTNPIGELTRTANKMAAGNLSIRFHPRGEDEIDQLGRTFNDLAGAVAKRETDLRNLAHSLEQTVQERTRELQEQNQYLAALHEVTLGLNENLDPERLLETIMTRAASLARAEHAFVAIVDAERGEMQLRVAQGRYRTHLGMWTRIDQGLSGRVQTSGQMMIEKDYQQFDDKHPDFDWLRTAIYVPLRSESAILGVIGLGYDRVVEVNSNYVDILDQFAQLAALALKNAQLYSAAQQELSETEQALLVEEERRQAYLTTPQGRAESMAENILKNPSQALVVFRDLTQKADQDANGSLLAELPGVMDQGGHILLARLAEGYHFIYRSNEEPELLTVGLRQLISGLAVQEARSLDLVEEAEAIYGMCYQAIDAASIHAITELLPSLRALLEKPDSISILAGLAGALNSLLPAAEALHAYERVETTEDRRDYLARAVEALSHADRFAGGLQAAERPIARHMIENWMALVTLSMSDLQTRAQISCHLLSRHSWKDEMVAVALRLRNEGHGMALNLRISLAQSIDYILVDEHFLVERLAPGEETQLEFRIRPQIPPDKGQFRAWFVILYDDPRGPNHTEHFADIVHLLAPEPAFQYIPNPYVAGTPLETGSPLFFGRDGLFSFIDENLKAAHRNNLVLIGQRRTGKSSLLKQLPLRLGENFLPVYLDGQNVALDPGLPAFFSNLAVEIGYTLQERGFQIVIPDMHAFREHPAHTFERDFLRQVRTAIGSRHLVLLLDEFEELEAAVRSGNLDASIFGFLRHLIQHESRLSVIFCGTHRMEELATDYWNVLFNISLYKHVGFLEYEEAVRLIQEPVTAFGMRYDDLALEKMWRITAGHPYFLQLLCHSLVNIHNRAGRSYVTVSDVNGALSEILSTGEAHFVYLWNESSRIERQVLTTLSRIMTLTGHIMAVQVEDYLNECGISPGRQVIADALHHLSLRDILAVQVDSQSIGTGGTYRWRLGLLGLWIERYKSLSLVQEEANE
jgi:HAMP domain-containing protein